MLTKQHVVVVLLGGLMLRASSKKSGNGGVKPGSGHTDCFACPQLKTKKINCLPRCNYGLRQSFPAVVAAWIYPITRRNKKNPKTKTCHMTEKLLNRRYNSNHAVVGYLSHTLLVCMNVSSPLNTKRARKILINLYCSDLTITS